MTKETIEFCENWCAFYNECAYRKRNIEYLCDNVQAFTHGFEMATEKACEWMVDNLNSPYCAYHKDEIIEKFKKIWRKNNDSRTVRPI